MDDVHFPQFLCLMKNPETEKVFRRKGPSGCSRGTGIDMKRNLPGKTIRHTQFLQRLPAGMI
jgi:hypothetical protein